MSKCFDADMIIIGAGPSGGIMAEGFVNQGLKCIMLEAGKHYNHQTYPHKEIDSNAQLYWGGGIEFTHQFDIGLIRPKVVGGGSIVNQALLDRFDENAWSAFKNDSGISFFNKDDMEPYYLEALSTVSVQEIPSEYRNKNAQVFIDGFEKNGFKYAPLVRAQKNCHYELGNDCIECLAGCRIDSKQSSAITTIRRAMEKGLKLKSEVEVVKIVPNNDFVDVFTVDVHGVKRVFRSKYVTLAAGAIGNSKILLMSDLSKKIPAIGNNFFTHPQFMLLGLYKEKINSHKGPFQAMKSADPDFRLKSFKLENVFAPPVAIAMLLPGFAKKHSDIMKKITHLACIEVATRDKIPGKITVSAKGKITVTKEIINEDLETRNKGYKAIHQIFQSTGAIKVINGEIGIGLHLMGGCSMGVDSNKAVISPDFNLFGFKNIFCADSSVFPNAPGINPSLTIMALSKMALSKIKRVI